MANESNNKPIEQLVFNGVDFDTGSYLFPPLTPEDIVEFSRAEYKGTTSAQKEFTKAQSDKASRAGYGFDVEIREPAEGRWGVIFAKGESDDKKEAIMPLIAHRAAQLGFDPKVFEYEPGMTYVDFVTRNGVAPGLGVAEKIPFYLLLVGTPLQIPFRFQFELCADYGVGRLDFPNADGYHAYVQQLIDYETSSAVPASKDTVFWATANPDDRATGLSSRNLASPLYEGLDPKLGFSKQLLLAEDATWENLNQTFSRAQAPSLVFTASHGLGFKKRNMDLQRSLQGALISQAWTPDTPVTTAQVFSGSDVAKSSNVRGMIHYAFACFGAGTPKYDDFAEGKSGEAPIIADVPFTSALAQQELLHGGLAFIGHIERAWTYSFIGATDKPMLAAFERAFKKLMRGLPVAYAMRDQYDHALILSNSLLEDLRKSEPGIAASTLAIANKWTERNDARAYAIVGDPAARLRTNP